MKKFLFFLCLATGTLAAQQAKVTPLMPKDLAGIPGKQAVMSTVEYAPGESGTIHRHNANVFVYVLEGTVIMQVKGANN